MFFFLHRAIPTTTRSAPSQGGLPSSAVFPARATGLRFLLSPVGATLLWLLALGLSSNALAQNYDPNGTTVAGGNGEGAEANQLSFPLGVFVDGSGNVYVADSYNHRIQKWALGATSGTTVAGGNGEGSGANQLSFPTGVSVDGSGNVYVADSYNHRIQKWEPGASSGTTVAGGNGRGPGANQLAVPQGVFVDGSGNVYVADAGNDRIQKWEPGASSGTTVAGGNGRGPGANQLAVPQGVFVDGSGNVYVADFDNDRIQKWEPGASSGTTVAGGNGRGSGADQLNFPQGVSVDGSGNVYVADTYNHRIQRWAPGAITGTTVAGGNGRGSGANQLAVPTGVYVDGSGNVYVADLYNNRIQKFSPLVAPLLTGLSASPNPVCAGQPVQFSATVGNVSGTYNYALTNGASSTIQGTASDPAFSQSLTAGGSGSQTYTLTITTEGGSTEATVSVTVNALPTPAITGLSAGYCKDAAAVTLSGTPAGGSFTTDNQTATQLNPASLSIGSHTVRYTVTQNGCTAFTERSVEIKALPDASFTGLAGLYCADAPAVTLTPTTAGGTFGGPGVSGSTFTPANAGSGGSITYTVTSAANGCTGTSSQSVVVNPVPTPAITGLAAAYCQNVGAVTLTGSPASGSFTIDGQSATQLNPANLSAGSHTVRYTVTQNGCTGFTERSVIINAPPTLAPGPDKSVVLGYGGPSSTCTDITATASGGSGGYTYVWNPGNLSGQTVPVCPQATTTYEVKATDANGCTSAPAQVTVKVKDVRCGPGDKSVTICYYGVTQCVSEKIAQRYLKLGATLGGCGTDNARIGYEPAEATLTLSLKAYPNPVQDLVTLEVLAPRAGVAHISVVDMAGRAVQQRLESLTQGLNEVELRLGALPTGNYLIRVLDAQNRQAVERVSKQ